MGLNNWFSAPLLFLSKKVLGKHINLHLLQLKLFHKLDYHSILGFWRSLLFAWGVFRFYYFYFKSLLAFIWQNRLMLLMLRMDCILFFYYWLSISTYILKNYFSFQFLFFRDVYSFWRFLMIFFAVIINRCLWSFFLNYLLFKSCSFYWFWTMSCNFNTFNRLKFHMHMVLFFSGWRSLKVKRMFDLVCKNIWLYLDIYNLLLYLFFKILFLLRLVFITGI